MSFKQVSNEALKLAVSGLIESANRGIFGSHGYFDRKAAIKLCKDIGMSADEVQNDYELERLNSTW